MHGHGAYAQGQRRWTPAFGRRFAGALVALSLALATAVTHADDDELHDPFMPPGWGETSAPAEEAFNASAWTLESTLTADGRRVAIINGRAVRPGDYVGGARVLGVERGSARLDYNGQRFTIRRPATQVRTSRESAQ
ncbi:MAG: hypothetical protein V5A42_04280 [Halofilum sp. (in: g-proteobacteria)]